MVTYAVGETALINNEITEYLEQEEDVLSYALFPQVAMNFFKARKEAKEGINLIKDAHIKIIMMI